MVCCSIYFKDLRAHFRLQGVAKSGVLACIAPSFVAGFLSGVSCSRLSTDPNYVDGLFDIVIHGFSG